MVPNYGVALLLLLTQKCGGFSSSTKKKKVVEKLNNNPLSKLRMDLCEFTALEGTVEDCSCSFADVDDATELYFGPLLREVTQRKFFKYFKADLDRQCQFWPEDGMCDRFECAVDQTCDELPEVWRMEDLFSSSTILNSLSLLDYYPLVLLSVVLENIIIIMSLLPSLPSSSSFSYFIAK